MLRLEINEPDDRASMYRSNWLEAHEGSWIEDKGLFEFEVRGKGRGGKGSRRGV